MIELPRRPAWMQLGLCAEVDPELFFPEKAEAAKVAKAKRICQSCDVIEQCLAYAIENNEADGVWGGTGTVERRKMISKLYGERGGTCDHCGAAFPYKPGQRFCSPECRTDYHNEVRRVA